MGPIRTLGYDLNKLGEGQLSNAPYQVLSALFKGSEVDYFRYILYVPPPPPHTHTNTPPEG